MDELEIKGRLRCLLTVHWGYYGCIPENSSFAIHALVHTHYYYGGFYLKGGAKRISETFCAGIIDNGGEIAVQANVKEIIIEEGEAKGVRLTTGEEFFAKNIISAAGVKTTVKNMMPQSYYDSDWGQNIMALKSSCPYLCLYMGFKGDISKHGAGAQNQWIYNTWENTNQYWDINDPNAESHILYISFPSLKDPEHDPGKELLHTGECVTFIKWEAVKEFADTEWGKRPEAYEKWKQQIADRMLKQLRNNLPKIMQFLDYYELSTPVTTQHFMHGHEGACYGLLTYEPSQVQLGICSLPQPSQTLFFHSPSNIQPVQLSNLPFPSALLFTKSPSNTFPSL